MLKVARNMFSSFQHGLLYDLIVVFEVYSPLPLSAGSDVCTQNAAYNNSVKYIRLTVFSLDELSSLTTFLEHDCGAS